MRLSVPTVKLPAVMGKCSLSSHLSLRESDFTCDDTATVSIFASSSSQLSAELRFRNCMSKTQKRFGCALNLKQKKEEEERIQWFETAQSLYLIENSTKHNISLGSF